MTKNKKLFVIGVIFIVMFLCTKCARADSFYELDKSLSSTIDSKSSPEPTLSPEPTISPEPTPSPSPDYSEITIRLDSLYELNSSTKNQILISIWTLTGLMIGYVIIKDSFR